MARLVSRTVLSGCPWRAFSSELMLCGMSPFRRYDSPMRIHRSLCSRVLRYFREQGGISRDRLVVLAGAHLRVAQFTPQIEVRGFAERFDLDQLDRFIALIFHQERPRLAQQAAQIVGLRRIGPAEILRRLLGFLLVQIEDAHLKQCFFLIRLPFEHRGQQSCRASS